MPTTDEELAELQQSVQDKRQALADAQALREASERSQVNDIAAAQLKEEAARLDAEIAREQALTANVGSGNTVLAVATAQMEQAVAQQEAQEKANEEAARLAEEQRAAAEAEIAAQAAATEQAAIDAAEAAAAAATTIEGSGQ